MAFGFFKKKKKEELPHYDPTNIGVMDIRKGFVFDFNTQSWEVTEEFEYDWGNNDFTYEFKVVSANETYFLYVEKDDEIECIFSQKIPFAKLDGSYYDEEEETVLTIEQWGERDFEASMGAVIHPSKITNILPVE
jgi:hypothetical protein